MKIFNAVFIKSAERRDQYPPEPFPEIAFAGRSNVGKSSMINCLVQRHNLARTSSTPGRTRLINFYLVNRRVYFADLPGYGYARVSERMRQGWKGMVEQYLEGRSQLKLLVLILDPRRGLESQELEFMDWLGQRDIPVLLAMTKVDKLKSKERAASIAGTRSLLRGRGTDLIQFSSATCEGREAIWNYFQALLGPLDLPTTSRRHRDE